MNINSEENVLGYQLKSKQSIYANYLIPTIFSCLLYILHFAADIVLTVQHFRDDNNVWASLTSFFMYLPSIGCYIITVSSWELWPKYEGCGTSNVKWVLLKTLQHLCFPIWSMWRFAERIFWTVEAIRTPNDNDQKECLDKVKAPRTIELYFFLQAFLQALPQILLQFHLLFLHFKLMSPQTVEIQIFSITMSIAKVAIVTTLYQRFKSIKESGKQYPWLKPYKYPYDPSVKLRKADRKNAVYTVKTLDQTENLEDELLTSTRLTMRRPSSDLYLEPVGDEILPLSADDENRSPRLDVPDFFPKKLIRALPEDNVVGKFISFLWWFCFLIARMLSIAVFGAFYTEEIIYIMVSHFILVVSLLLYDVRADEVRRAKAIFFIFIGYVYLFTLIEFKIKFKKPKFIYNGFFLLMFSEIFISTIVWYSRLDLEVEFWWYDYILYLILGTSLLSLLTMLFYMQVLKPKKVTVYNVET